jgi:hydrogenase maturation protease
VREATGEGTALLELWKGADDVILVDAVSSASVPGTVTSFDAVAAPLPALFSGCSSHSFGVAEAVELARTLDRLPRRLTVYGIEGGDFTHGTGLSPEVARAVDELVGRILGQVVALRGV